jgi:transposase
MEPHKPYPTDLGDREWALIQHLVPTAKPGGRPEQYPKREILDAIFYILRGDVHAAASANGGMTAIRWHRASSAPWPPAGCDGWC